MNALIPHGWTEWHEDVLHDVLKWANYRRTAFSDAEFYEWAHNNERFAARTTEGKCYLCPDVAVLYKDAP